ncbi:MAG: hypothetical protein PHN32_02435 [Actinomycetota bacterium]|jgi:hypothetical protein|nr:hypothetical protein [Actinomycetota bacterium]
MTSLEIIGLVAIILMSAFSIIAIILAVPIFKLLSKANRIIGSVSDRIDPMVGDLNLMVGKLNVEISSINDITRSAGSIVEQLEKIIRLARIVVTSPIIKVISTGAGLISGIKKAKNSE